MIKSEKKIQIIELPFYYLKLILNKISKKRVNAINVSHFDDYGDEIVVVNELKDLKIYQSKFQIYDDLHFLKTGSISINLKEEKSFKYLYRGYLEIINIEGLPVDDNKNIILNGYYKRPFRRGKLKRIGFFSIKYHANMMLGSLFKPVNRTNYKNAFILTSRWSENYYHWMTEIIPRLTLINKINHEIDIVIINQLSFQFQKDSLKYIDIKKNIVETKSKHAIEIQN